MALAAVLLGDLVSSEEALSACLGVPVLPASPDKLVEGVSGALYA